MASQFDTSRYRFVAEALDGSGGFRPVVSYDANGKPVSVGRTHLIPYPRESDERFARRNEVAWYANDLARACGRFAGYLAKRPPLRDLGRNPLHEEFLDNCNWRDDDLDVFWRTFMVEARARGAMLLLVDMPSRLPEDRASQIQQRAIPYLVPIKPEDVTHYEIGVDGRFSVVRVADERVENGIRTRIEREWTTTGWSMRAGEKVIEEGEHNLGACPVLFFSESGEFPCYGEFAQIADISRRLFNLHSELDELLRGQTFSILTYKVPEARFPLDLSGITDELGSSNLLQTFGEGAEFVAPAADSAEIYLGRITQLEKKIDDISMTVETPDSAESGIAMQLRFQALNASLIGFARSMEDLERRVWDLVCRWLGIDNRVETSWSKDFSIADVTREMQVLSDMQATGMPDEVVREQQKVVVAAQFGSSENNVIDDLIEAIDQAEQEPKSPESQEDPSGSPG